MNEHSRLRYKDEAWPQLIEGHDTELGVIYFEKRASIMDILKYYVYSFLHFMEEEDV